MNMIKGIGASSGINLAKAFILKKPKFNINDTKINDTKNEIDLVKQSIAISIEQLDKIKEKATISLGEDKAAIFAAHIQIVNDPEILNQIIEMIEKEKVNSAFAINSVFKQFHEIFSSMEDAYFKERASDINDVLERLLSIHLNVKMPNLLEIDEEVIIIAHDLTPSETVLLNKKYVKGFVTNIGGRTSHSAIMARTMEIPAVLGLKNVLDIVKDDDLIALDGDKGIVEINPDNVELWNKNKEIYLKEKEELKQYINKKATTTDGHTVDIETNIGKPNDVDNLDEYGYDGIGLYRSEFLYMDSTNWPSQKTQYDAYKYVLEKNPEKIVIVRTLDIGGDKKLPYFTFDHEDNPFLGHRAIRFTIDNLEIFKTQLKALLQASVHGKLGIMFPMICNLDELHKALEIYNQCKKELDNENIKYSNDVKIGMMIEIPSTAILADKFAKYVDFFSIGTNDLIQYTFAVDRMSEKITHLYQPNNPSLLRMIELTIEGAKKHNKIVAMCGEMAGDIMSIPLLLGLGKKGLDAFSMSASSMLKAKKIICSLSHQECIDLASKAIELETTEQVNKLVGDFLKSKNLI